MTSLPAASYTAGSVSAAERNRYSMRTIEVKILGQRYKVRSDEGEDYIKSLAQFVNEQILQVQRSSQTVATHNVAILAALHIADDLFKVREENGLIKKIT